MSGSIPIQFNGVIWEAVGALGSLDFGSETTDGSAGGVKAMLLQIPSDYRDDLTDQAVRGCLAEVFVGVLDETFTSVIGFKRIRRGTVQGYDIDDQGSTISVTVTIETKAINQRLPAQKRFTDEWQQRKYPGDLFFQYVSQMAEVPILWAAASQDSTVSGAGGGGGGAAFINNANVQRF